MKRQTRWTARRSRMRYKPSFGDRNAREAYVREQKKNRFIRTGKY